MKKLLILLLVVFIVGCGSDTMVKEEADVQPAADGQAEEFTAELDESFEEFDNTEEELDDAELDEVFNDLENFEF